MALYMLHLYVVPQHVSTSLMMGCNQKKMLPPLASADKRKHTGCVRSSVKDFYMMYCSPLLSNSSSMSTLKYSACLMMQPSNESSNYLAYHFYRLVPQLNNNMISGKMHFYNFQESNLTFKQIFKPNLNHKNKLCIKIYS